MKIILTGGGTGGHFYPILAVAEAIRQYAKEQKLLEPELYYVAPHPYDPTALFNHKLEYIKVPAGKIRRYFSILNFFDAFKTMWGMLKALIVVYNIYPDVVFGKGGYVSFPVLFAARILRIPVVIHESDSVPGKANAWAAKFAERIAVSYPEASAYFPKDKVALTGNPVRKEIAIPVHDGAHEFFELDHKTPTLLILGGSLGSQIINDTILDALPRLVSTYQIIHQTGRNNISIVKETAGVVLQNNPHKDRYRSYPHLNPLELRMAAGIADIVVSRAGSTIFEIAAWGVPSVLIPIKDSNGDHQRKNAFNYARTGAAVVIEENNLTPNVLLSEVKRIAENQELRQKMRDAASGFKKLNAADTIAREIVRIALEHEE